MSIISITAEAGRDICRRIASGELEVAGIQVREAGSKQIRYILRGLENLPADRTVLDGFPPLAPLLQAIGITQLLGVVAVAQNGRPRSAYGGLSAILPRSSGALTTRLRC